MRQGRTIVPAGLVLVAGLLGAGGPGRAPESAVAVTDERFGHPIAPIFLLLRPDVQRDMKLDSRQVAAAGDLAGRLVERLLLMKAKAGQAAMTERRAIDEAMEAGLRQILTEAHRERLTQITLQWEGASALRRPSVADYLGLVEPQRLRIENLLLDRDRRQAAGALGPAEFDRLSRDAQMALNPLQRQQWERLLGPPCRFAIGNRPGSPGDPASAPVVRGRPPSAGR